RVPRRPVFRKQYARLHRQGRLFRQWRRLSDADQEEPSTARSALFQADAEVERAKRATQTLEAAMDQRNFTGDYDTLLELVKTRVSVRNLKPDPIPDDYVTKILEVGRWAMSGANGQPWDFVIVKDAAIKKELFRVYTQENNDFIYWMEQQRDFN